VLFLVIDLITRPDYNTETDRMIQMVIISIGQNKQHQQPWPPWIKNGMLLTVMRINVKLKGAHRFSWPYGV